MYIHWGKEFETGQPLIDAEHRLLVMLFRKLDVAIKTSEPRSTIARIVIEVRKFVEFHIVSEENLMRETNYPGFEAHRELHSNLLTDLSIMISKVGTHREFPDDLLSFVNDWLIDHIAHHDQALARHVRKAVKRPVAELIYSDYLLTPAPDLQPAELGVPATVPAEQRARQRGP